jgi:3-hydroxy-9,10-secoandrosta-1,3,5(10)-triene-9,17-dione monooxygenase reductase component
MTIRKGDPSDGRAFRHALGSFATGVTIVTTLGEAGERFGVTANSFSSVSLDPPLVLWSLSNRSRALGAFAACRHFAVHVLRASQIGLSNQFARPGDKFAGVQVETGPDGVPMLPDFLARFVCRNERVVEGGDHAILLGRVASFEYADGDPLLFVQGEYAAATLHPDRIRDLRTGQSRFAPEDVDYWL